MNFKASLLQMLFAISWLPELDSSDVCPLPPDLMLGVASFRDWRDPTKPEQQKRTLLPFSRGLLSTCGKCDSVYLMAKL